MRGCINDGNRSPISTNIAERASSDFKAYFPPESKFKKKQKTMTLEKVSV
jgi:hypothetical protein